MEKDGQLTAKAYSYVEREAGRSHILLPVGILSRWFSKLPVWWDALVVSWRGSFNWIICRYEGAAKWMGWQCIGEFTLNNVQVKKYLYDRNTDYVHHYNTGAKKLLMLRILARPQLPWTERPNLFGAVSSSIWCEILVQLHVYLVGNVRIGPLTSFIVWISSQLARMNYWLSLVLLTQLAMTMSLCSCNEPVTWVWPYHGGYPVVRSQKFGEISYQTGVEQEGVQSWINRTREIEKHMFGNSAVTVTIYKQIFQVPRQTQTSNRPWIIIP